MPESLASLDRAAETRSDPIPGSANTDSVTAEPAAAEASDDAISVYSTGSDGFRALWVTRLFLSAPNARSESVNGFDIFSSSAFLKILIMREAWRSARVREGRRSDLSHSRSDTDGLVYPAGGNSPRPAENMIMRKNPVRNDGMAIMRTLSG